MGELIHLLPHGWKRMENHYEQDIEYHERCKERDERLLGKLLLENSGQMELFNGNEGDICQPK